MVKVFCRTIKASDLCIAEVSPGDRLTGPVLTVAAAGSSNRKQRPSGHTVCSHRYVGTNMLKTH